MGTAITVEDLAKSVCAAFQRKYAGKAVHKSGNDSMLCIDELHNVTLSELLHNYQNGNPEEMKKNLISVISFAFCFANLQGIDLPAILSKSFSSKSAPAPKPKKKW